MNIIFVCTGNTCRSPMAQGILQRLAPEWGVISRGIFVDPGSRTHQHDAAFERTAGYRPVRTCPSAD